MLKWTLVALAALVVVLVVVVALQPSDFRIERSAAMRAPASAATKVRAPGPARATPSRETRTSARGA